MPLSSTSSSRVGWWCSIPLYNIPASSGGKWQNASSSRPSRSRWAFEDSVTQPAWTAEGQVATLGSVKIDSDGSDIVWNYSDRSLNDDEEIVTAHTTDLEYFPPSDLITYSTYVSALTPFSHPISLADTEATADENNDLSFALANHISTTTSTLSSQSYDIDNLHDRLAYSESINSALLDTFDSLVLENTQLSSRAASLRRRVRSLERRDREVERFVDDLSVTVAWRMGQMDDEVDRLRKEVRRLTICTRSRRTSRTSRRRREEVALDNSMEDEVTGDDFTEQSEGLVDVSGTETEVEPPHELSAVSTSFSASSLPGYSR